MHKLLIIIILACFLSSCGLNTTRNILPIPEADVSLLPRSKGLATTKNGISVIVVPLQSVKELDGFGVMIINETSNWISIKREDCVMIQGGDARYPLNNKQVSNRMGSSYKSSMPDELKVDIFEWRRNINTLNTRDLKIVDENLKISIMAGTKETIFLYFKTIDSTSPIQLILSNIFNEATKQRTRFSFKFTVEKK
ncbi:hypothetical protein FJZ33_08825 [Candidatus Poribacteria bacterium]|nr:hypothetical protein [Candidatus Poribacteria bacterium]